MSDPEATTGPALRGGASQLALAGLLLLLPAAHPVLRLAGVGVASHLLWVVHVLPVALVSYRFGRRAGFAAVAASASAILLGERLFGGGYGIPASWETAVSLAVSVGFAEALVAEFARYAREARDRQARSAERDALTGLPNRRRLRAAIRETVREQPGGSGCFGLLFLDLDRFKRFNDSLGHTVGDEILQSAARRLRRALRSGDLLARVGGDEFVVLLTELDRREEAVKVGHRLVELLSDEPVSAAGHRIRVTASVGVVARSFGEADSEGVIRDAATALRKAKERPAADVVLFREEMHEDARRRLHLETGLQGALQRGEFELHFQPVFAANGLELRGAEALLRWNHPERGLVSPGEFLPVVREAGLTIPVGSWVIEAASRQAAAWGPEVEGTFVMSLNLDAPQFSHRRFEEDMRAAARRVRDAGARLEVEITEDELMSDVVAVEDCLGRLSELEVDLAVDDFGTGYSSLRYLHAYPMDVLKIDRSFVCAEEGAHCSPAIARTIITLGRSLGLRTVAEGIETRFQHERLREQGVDYVQGYFFGRPVPAEAYRKAYLGAGARRAGTASAGGSSR